MVKLFLFFFFFFFFNYYSPEKRGKKSYTATSGGGLEQYNVVKPNEIRVRSTALSQAKRVFFASVTLSLPKNDLLKVLASFPGHSHVR